MIGRRRTTAIALAIVAVLAMTGCGVSASDGPQPIESDIAELLEPQDEPTVPETEPKRLVTVTWVRGDRLARTPRIGVAETPQERLDSAFAALLSGPRAAEQTRGLTTLLPPDVQVSGEIKRRRAVVALDLGGGLEPGGLSLAIGQVAVTALAVPGVQSVVFTVDGTPTAVPVPSSRGSGRDIVRVVRASDYRKVLAR